MREQEDRGEQIHQRIWDLLPWYVNGSLAEREREWVEAHLAACLRCQEEERLCRRMAGDVVRGGEIAPAPHPVQLQRMLARIEESEEESAEPRRLLAPLRSLVQATPRPLRGALVAQAAVILLLIGFLAWSLSRPGATPMPPSAYRTLSNPDAAPVPTVRLRVMFSPQATEKEIRELLQGIHGEITAGPSRMGAYTVEVPATGDPEQIVLTRLRAEPQVMLAEPVAGVPGEAGR